MASKGGRGADKSACDKARAAAMKRLGITRKIGLCPVCHRQVALARIYDHIVSCTASA